VTHTTITAGGIEARLISFGDVICKQISVGQRFEPDTLERWIDLCGRGGTVLDIGAYTGLFSILAAKCGCAVTAIEPMPKHVERCRENFGINGVKAELITAAASDCSGKTVIKFNPKVPGLTSGASLIRPSGGRESRPIDVAAIAVDDLHLSDVVAMKIDVERGEPVVLAGARETIGRYKPAIVIEVLGPQEKEAVRGAVQGYFVAAEMDGRNWLMLPN
jgi:FkbM family methyltransferase